MSTIENPDDATLEQSTSDDRIEIRLLTTADEMTAVVDVFQQVWGSVTELARIEMLMAIAHSGGYVCGAFESGPEGDDRILGASVAFLARHHGRPALHSHITGLLPGARHSGLGRGIKLHQQAWARDNGIEWIVWTYDPLVRRNGWFNIAVLGAEVHGYMESFYGEMTDAINAGDQTDRLLVAWNAFSEPDDTLHDGHDHPGAVLIPTPDDIVTLRRTESDEAARWRIETRASLGGALNSGRKVVGFTRHGEYVVEPPR